MGKSKVQIGDSSLVISNSNNSNVEREYKNAVNGSYPYRDRSFNLADSSNYGNPPSEIFEVKPKEDIFVDEPGTDDIKQGNACDCWFLSSLCSLAHEANVIKHSDSNIKRRALIDAVYERSLNTKTKNAAYLFNFFKMGEWQKVVVDNQLPLKCPYSPQSGIIKRGTTFKPDEVEEFWALLLEKAFAKMSGGYMKLQGGFPRCAMTFLTGGITTADLMDTKDLVNELDKRDIFGYLKRNKEHILVNASNYEGATQGLVAGHAYSVEDYVEMHGVKLVRLQNPWGEGEWTGDYGDEWLERNKHKFSSREQKILGIDGNLDNDDDGLFFMTWEEFMEEFEQLTVCHLAVSSPSSPVFEMRAIGNFSYNGNDCPSDIQDMCDNYLNPAKSLQFNLTIKQSAKSANIKFQLLMDLPMKATEESDKRLVFFSMHKGAEIRK